MKIKREDNGGQKVLNEDGDRRIGEAEVEERFTITFLFCDHSDQQQLNKDRIHWAYCSRRRVHMAWRYGSSQLVQEAETSHLQPQT